MINLIAPNWLHWIVEKLKRKHQPKLKRARKKGLDMIGLQYNIEREHLWWMFKECDKELYAVLEGE